MENKLRDIVAKEITGVQIGTFGHKLWVCVDGKAVLRVKSPEIEFIDLRITQKEEETLDSGALYRTIEFNEPIRVRSGDNYHLKDGIVTVVDKVGNQVGTGTYSIQKVPITSIDRAKFLAKLLDNMTVADLAERIEQTEEWIKEKLNDITNDA